MQDNVLLSASPDRARRSAQGRHAEWGGVHTAHQTEHFHSDLVFQMQLLDNHHLQLWFRILVTYLSGWAALITVV